MSNEKSENYFIDILKLLFSICVVVIHTNLFIDKNIYLYGYLRNIILLIAVPFFFLVSGYFFGINIKKEKKQKEYLLKYQKKIAFHWVIWGLFYLILYIAIYIYQGEKNKVFLLIKKHLMLLPNGAIWYLPALIINIFLVYLIRNKKQIQKSFLVISFILMNSYQLFLFLCLFQKNGIMIQIYSFFEKFNNGFFRAIIYGYFFVALGFFTSNYKTICNVDYKIKCITMIIVGMIVNVIFTYFQIISIHKFDDIQIEIYFGTILLAYAIFLISLNNKLILNSKYKLLRNLSSTIYYTHYAIISIFKIIFNCFGIESTILLTVLSIFTVVTVSVILNKSNNKFIRKII